MAAAACPAAGDRGAGPGSPKATTAAAISVPKKIIKECRTSFMGMRAAARGEVGAVWLLRSGGPVSARRQLLSSRAYTRAPWEGGSKEARR